MKKIFAILLIVAFSFSGWLYATTVTTKDGVNFTITNDAGLSANYTLPQINAIEAQRNATFQSDLQIAQQEQQTQVVDGQFLYEFAGVQQIATNEYNAGSTNATCSTNTTCWSGACTNSVCE